MRPYNCSFRDDMNITEIGSIRVLRGACCGERFVQIIPVWLFHLYWLCSDCHSKPGFATQHHSFRKSSCLLPTSWKKLIMESKVCFSDLSGGDDRWNKVMTFFFQMWEVHKVKTTNKSFDKFSKEKAEVMQSPSHVEYMLYLTF